MVFETVVYSYIYYPSGYNSSNGKRVALKVVGQAFTPPLLGNILGPAFSRAVPVDDPTSARSAKCQRF